MTDREKVIDWLEKEIKSNDYWDEDYIDYIPVSVLKNILALLKAQEPILLENQHKPYGISTNVNSPWISRCPRCGKKVEGKQARFCKYCGQVVKWE